MTGVESGVNCLSSVHGVLYLGAYYARYSSWQDPPPTAHRVWESVDRRSWGHADLLMSKPHVGYRHSDFLSAGNQFGEPGPRGDAARVGNAVNRAIDYGRYFPVSINKPRA